MIERVAESHIKKISETSPSKVMFVQAVLDTPRDLINWFQDKTGLDPEGEGWKVATHHMTIEFFDKKEKKALKREGKPEANILLPYADLIGKSVVLDIIGYAHDDKGMVVLVEPRGSLANIIKNDHPHITIATKGVGAKYSNDLLKKGEIITARGSIQARVGWKNPRGNTDEFDLPWELRG